MATAQLQKAETIPGSVEGEEVVAGGELAGQAGQHDRVVALGLRPLQSEEDSLLDIGPATHDALGREALSGPLQLEGHAAPGAGAVGKEHRSAALGDVDEHTDPGLPAGDPVNGEAGVGTGSLAEVGGAHRRVEGGGDQVGGPGAEGEPLRHGLSLALPPRRA